MNPRMLAAKVGIKLKTRDKTKNAAKNDVQNNGCGNFQHVRKAGFCRQTLLTTRQPDQPGYG
ncbi:hypothetical protein GCM10007879_22620 [Maritalea porphyrae]|uniref:Uncharacterized protein n=1 Tax=Maritalea porphyrae TaxID=880732 RepID=A0ABQ5US45_9HYPH|nr:hypothetical protein GCM10007879_22620 [Maritalea porphyrae]